MEVHSSNPVHVSIRNLKVEVEDAASTWENLRQHFVQPSPDIEGGGRNSKPILDGVSADMPPGSLTAIIGGSGSGKTTLLNTIAQRVSSKRMRVSGLTTFNGSEILDSVRIAYLMQQDILLPTLSVRETLQYAADLRLPLKVTKEKRKSAVEKIISDLELKDCADTRVGNNARAGRGCSGGEKRRTSIGVQMLADPSVLFCDEPTTGLDAHTAFQIVQTLKQLAENGKTIILSIHTPRSEIWNLFDNVILLSRGYTLYSGPTSEAITHFSECGHDLPPFVNPAEFLIDLSGVDNRSEEAETVSTVRVLGLRDAWRQNCTSKSLFSSTQTQERTQGNLVPKVGVGFRRQVSVLTKRTTKVTIRDPLGIAGSMFEAVIMSIVCGLIFYQLGKDAAGIRSREGALYTASAQQAYLILMFEIYRLTIDIPLFDRERSEGVVSVSAFLVSRRLSRLLVEDLVVPTIFSIIYYFMVGFRYEIESFLVFLGVMIVLQFVTVTLATVCVAVSRDFAIASLVANGAYTLQTFCCGYFVQSQQIPIWVRWLKWIAYGFYLFGSLAANEFIGPKGGSIGQYYDCPYSSDPQTLECRQYTGRYIMNSLGLPANWIWRPIVASASFIILFFSLAWGLLTFRIHDIDMASARKSNDDNKGKEARVLQSTVKLPQVSISIENYGLCVRRRHLWKPNYTKVILNPITTIFENSKLNVIMGPSGSGKTSLLLNLAQRQHSTFFSHYNTSGHVQLNGTVPSTEILRSVISFVMQDDDTLMPALTVRETLRFAAGLRLPSSMSKTEKRQRADDVILKMGLKDCADNIIGDNLRKGISGGEKRRVSIAIQILTDPKVLFLDEPTSGLDTHTARSVIEVLRILAEEGRTIVMTAHQPSSDIFQTFDNVLLLARGGAPIFSGNRSNMLPYFNDFGFKCPQTTNPADFALDLIAVDLQETEKETATQERLENLIQQWGQSSKSVPKSAFTQITNTSDFQSLKKEMNPFRITFPYIVRRSFLNIKRSPAFITARIMQTFAFTIIFSLFFSPLQSNQEAVQSRMGLVQETAALYFVGMLQNIAIYPFDRDTFYREHADNCYGVSTFLLSYTLLEIPFEIISSLFFGALLAFATNLKRTPIFFLISALNCFCVISCGESVGIVFCTLFSHTGFSLNITSVLLTIATIMAGVISLDMPTWLQDINYLSPLKYEVANMAVYAMQDHKFTCSLDQMVGGVCPISTGEEVLKVYNLDKDPGMNLMAFGIVTIGYRIIAWLVLVITMKGI